MKLLVVIVCYRVVDLTVDCLRSLAPEVPRVPGARVTVCENGTGGDAADRLARAIEENGWGGWCDLTVIDPNRGFTGGNNHVLRAALVSPAPPDYVLLLNADTVVLPGALAALVEFMDSHPKVGIAGSRLEAPDGSVHNSAFRFHTALTEFDRGMRLGLVSGLIKRWAVCPPPAPEACQVPWVSGASMIIRRQVLEKIGPLDEGYYTYFDDIDYCFNAGKAGWPTWYVPRSRVVHLEGASTGIGARDERARRRLPPYWFQARRRFFVKNYGPLYAALADAAYIVGLAMFRLRRRIQRKPDPDPPQLLWDSIRNSIFFTGPRLRDVENPALARPAGPPVPPAVATGAGS